MKSVNCLNMFLRNFTKISTTKRLISISLPQNFQYRKTTTSMRGENRDDVNYKHENSRSPPFKYQQKKFEDSKTTTTKTLKSAKNEIDEEDFRKTVDQMNEYFNQYLDEYYEEELDGDDEEEKELNSQFELKKQLEVKLAAEEKRIKRKSNALINNATPKIIVEFLREQRITNIVCLNIPFEKSPNEYAIICSPHNSRHAESVIENVRKFIKDNYRYEDNQLPTKLDCLGGWYTIDMRSIILHMMTPKIRARYDLELLYALGSEKLSDPMKNQEDDNEECQQQQQQKIIPSKKNEYEKWLDMEDEGLRPLAPIQKF